MADLRTSALALLNAEPTVAGLSRKAGSFLGQCVAEPSQLTPKQADWLATLLERAGLPPLDAGDIA